MKRILAIFAVYAAIGGNVKLQWDYEAGELTHIAEFRLYEITQTATNLIGIVPATNLTFRTNYSMGEHKIFATAVTPDNIESDPSNIVTFWMPKAPTNVVITIK